MVHSVNEACLCFALNRKSNGRDAHMRKDIHLIVTILLALSLPAAVGAAPTDEPAGPRVQIAAPPNEATIMGNQVEILVDFNSGERQPVSKVQVFLDGKAVTERVYEAPAARGTCIFKWDTVRSSNGQHKLDVQVFSGDAYLGMASCTVTVSNKVPDLTPPRVLITSPREGEVVSGVTPIAIEASDNSGREPFVNIYVDKSLRCVKNFGPYAHKWDTTGHENGPHVIQATAVDESGNTSDAKPVRVIVRNAVKMMPLATQPAPEKPAVPEAAAEPLPTLPALLERSSSATPTEDVRESDTMKQEHARALQEDFGTPAESFEVGQTALTRVNPPSVPSTRIRQERVPEHIPAVAEPSIPAQDTAPATPKPAAETPKAEPAQPVVKADARVASALAAVKSHYTEVSGPSPENVYIVRAGDSIIRLAKKFLVPARLIVELNGIEDPNLIRIGDKLRIPTADVTMVPIRPVFEQAGGVMTWDQEARTVRAVCPENDVELEIGSTRAIVNCEQVTMDAAAAVRAGRTVVSKSFVTGTLGMTCAGE